jgi:flagellin
MSIALSTSAQQSVFSLGGIVELLGQTNEHLNTGKSVNSASDDPIKFFTAASLESDAADFSKLKDSINLGIGAVKEALGGIESITAVVNQLSGLASGALAADASSTTRTNNAATFTSLLAQIDTLSADAKFNGKNLIGENSTNLTVNFNPGGTSSITITGSTLSTVAGAGAGAGLNITAASNAWATDGDIQESVTSLNTALATLRSKAAAMGAGLAVMQSRLDFTEQHIQNDKVGAGKLTLADLNQEGATMKALQFRQQAGIQSLSIDAQSQMSVLGLIAR